MRFPVTPASQSALFRETSGAECTFPWGDATFAQVRKSAFYEKAHSACTPSRKGALCVLESGAVVPHPVFCRPADTPDTVHKIR